MTNDDIAQKLALLPEGLAEENIYSWKHVLKLFELFASHEGGYRYKPFVELIQTMHESEQAKLFRAGMSVTVLMISTKEEHGLHIEDAYIYALIKDNNLIEVGYYPANSKKAETYDCNKDELITRLQLFLDRLWNETRGKKNA